MDTGSSDLWVYNALEFAGGFDTNASTSFSSNNSEFGVDYLGNTFASGVWAHDTLNLSGQAMPVNFGLASEGNATMGVLGLGAGSTIWTSLRNDCAPIYSVQFGDVLTGGDHIVLGGVDTQQTLEAVPLVGSSIPAVMLHGLGIDNQQVASFSGPALLDIGTTRTHLPGALVEAIAQTVNATWVNDTWVQPCSGTWFLQLNFSGIVIEVSSDDLVQAVDSEGNCSLCLQQSDDIMIIGLDVLRSCVFLVDFNSTTAAIGQRDLYTVPEYGSPGVYAEAPGFNETTMAVITLFRSQTMSSEYASLSASSATLATSSSSTSTTLASSNLGAHEAPQFWHIFFSLYI